MTGPAIDAGDEIVEIRTTFDAAAAAETGATTVVRDRLAACGQIDGPIRSTYRWQGAVETATEWRCTFKTTVARSAACQAAIAAAHSYETPEIILVRAIASPAYAAWVRASVGDEP
jgi:periplasmic divalent cation tolerance protein